MSAPQTPGAGVTPDALPQSVESTETPAPGPRLPVCNFMSDGWCVTHKRFCETRRRDQEIDDQVAGRHYPLNGEGVPDA